MLYDINTTVLTKSQPLQLNTRVQATIAAHTGANPYAVLISPDSRIAYIANAGASTVFSNVWPVLPSSPAIGTPLSSASFSSAGILVRLGVKLQ